YNSVQKFLVKDKPIEEEFIDLCKKYDNRISPLNFKDFRKFNVWEESKVLKEDIEKLFKFQAALAESITDADTTAIYFELFSPLIKNVAIIFSKVADIYRTAKYNKRITKILWNVFLR